jgi:CheY-like chemotaxis protein
MEPYRAEIEPEIVLPTNSVSAEITPATMFETQGILLVDHDAAQAGAIREVFEKQRVANIVHAVATGTEAIAYLSGEGKYADRINYPLPGFMLLDLAVTGGFEVLIWVREHPELKRLPVVVLTHSSQPEHISRVYALGANSYLIKPFDTGKLRELVKAINAYWVILVQKPNLS